jgi:hypothetical protein
VIIKSQKPPAASFITHDILFADPGRIYIKGYIYIYIPYPIQKSGKRILSYPFFEWDMLKDIYPYFRDIHIFISYPILYPFSVQIWTLLRFFSFAQCSFCLRLLWGVLFWITHCTGSNEAVRQARQLLKKLPTKVSRINKYTLAKFWIGSTIDELPKTKLTSRCNYY